MCTMTALSFPRMRCSDMDGGKVATVGCEVAPLEGEGRACAVSHALAWGSPVGLSRVSTHAPKRSRTLTRRKRAVWKFPAKGSCFLRITASLCALRAVGFFIPFLNTFSSIIATSQKGLPKEAFLVSEKRTRQPHAVCSSGMCLC